MKQEGNFIIMSNNIITGDNTLIEEIGDKALLVYIYLQQHKTLRGQIYFSIEDIVKECGYIPKTGNGKTNDKFKDILKIFIKNKIITIDSDSDLDKVKAKELLKCTMQDVDEQFFQLFDNEYNTIMQYQGKEDKLNILKVFCLLKARMYKNNNDGGSIIDGHFEVCFPSYESIARDTLIGEGQIKQYIDILVKLDLIRYANLGARVDIKTGEYKDSNNTYVIYKDGWEHELKNSLKYYKTQNEEKGYKHMQNKNDRRKLGGEKGRINKKIKDGQATEKDFKRLEEIESILNKEKKKSSE